MSLPTGFPTVGLVAVVFQMRPATVMFVLSGRTAGEPLSWLIQKVR